MKLPSLRYRTVWVVLVALLVLLGVALALAWLPPFFLKPLVTVGLSGLKTALVIWYFMRARQAEGITPFYIAVGFIWLALLALIGGADYLTR
ncbi:MAG: hypothetical protein ACFB21_05290 [Opitutales bacterium]